MCLPQSYHCILKCHESPDIPPPTASPRQQIQGDNTTGRNGAQTPDDDKEEQEAVQHAIKLAKQSLKDMAAKIQELESKVVTEGDLDEMKKSYSHVVEATNEEVMRHRRSLDDLSSVVKGNKASLNNLGSDIQSNMRSIKSLNNDVSGTTAAVDNLSKGLKGNQAVIDKLKGEVTLVKGDGIVMKDKIEVGTALTIENSC